MKLLHDFGYFTNFRPEMSGLISQDLIIFTKQDHRRMNLFLDFSFLHEFEIKQQRTYCPISGYFHEFESKKV